jgi:spermidine/putrescine-binding protein
MKGVMRSLARSVKGGLAALFACALLLSGAEASAQGYRVNVYNPDTYSRTRQTMTNRAALRAALKRKRLRKARAARAKRAVLPPIVN